MVVLFGCQSSVDNIVKHGEDPDYFLKKDYIKERITIPESIQTESNTFTLEWVDNFDTEDMHWIKGDWTFNENLSKFSPDMVYVKDGLLRLGIREVLSTEKNKSGYREFWGGEYTTDISPLPTNKEPSQYGRFTARMKANSPKGVVTSFFLFNYHWNEDYTALKEGCEIDIEFCGRTDQVELAIHYVDPDGVLQHADVPIIKLPSDAGDGYHLWEIEVMPDYINYYYDGEIIHTFDDPSVMAELKHPLYTSMNYWIASSEQWVGKLDKKKLPLVTLYDYVAFYRLDM